MQQVGEVIEKEEGLIEWTASDFRSLPARVDVGCFSPSFSFGGERWYLLMFTNGQKLYKSEGHVDVYLRRESRSPVVRMAFSLGLKISDNEVARETDFTHEFDEKLVDYGCHHYLKRSELLGRRSELAPSGHLTFVCRLEHPEPQYTTGELFDEYHH